MAAIIVTGTQADDATTELVFAGSGSNLAITRILAQAFLRQHPDLRIEIPKSIGSKGGIRAVADGTIHVGLVSRPLKEEERKLGLIMKPYARTAVVFGVNASVEETAVSSNQVLEIFKGLQSRWTNRSEIIVLVREPGDSSVRVLEQKIQGFKSVFADAWQSKRWIALYTDQRMNHMLSKTPHAIGITDMGSIQAGRWGIKALRFDGVYPTVENIGNRSYPLTKVLAFVYDGQRLPPQADTFMTFVGSASGRDVLYRNGYAAID